MIFIGKLYILFKRKLFLLVEYCQFNKEILSSLIIKLLKIEFLKSYK